MELFFSGRDRYYDQKKRYSRLSGGCAIVITTGKKDTVVCLAGARSLLRPEKKDTVVCLAGARSLLQPEKKVQHITLTVLYDTLST